MEVDQTEALLTILWTSNYFHSLSCGAGAQLDSTQDPDGVPMGHGTPSDVHELLQQNYLWVWCPGLAAETCCVPGEMPLGRRMGGESRFECSPGKGSPPGVTNLISVLAVWVLHSLTWLSALKGARQEFKELLLSCQMERASSGFQKCFILGFLAAWLCCTMSRRTTQPYLQSTYPFPCLCERGHICTAVHLVLLCRSPHSLCQAGAELAAAQSYLMKGCSCLCSVVREGVVLQGGDPFSANAGTKKTLITSRLAGISKQQRLTGFSAVPRQIGAEQFQPLLRHSNKQDPSTSLSPLEIIWKGFSIHSLENDHSCEFCSVAQENSELTTLNRFYR